MESFDKLDLSAININELIKDKNVLIIGTPASGKTYLSGIIDSSNHQLIHTDDYIKYGFKDSMYKVLADIKDSNNNTIVEGVQGYRLLRKGVELDCYYPDVVIELVVSEEKRNEIYENERDPKKLKYMKGFEKSCKKILADYSNMGIDEKNVPKWIRISNNY